MVDTKKYQGIVEEAIYFADQITPTVIVLARGLGIEAKRLAMWLSEDNENALYRTEVATTLIAEMVKQAVANEKESKKAEAKANKE